MSQTLQYIIVYIILTGVVIWVIYKLIRTKQGKENTCSCCSKSSCCGKKALLDKKSRRSGTAENCPDAEKPDEK